MKKSIKAPQRPALDPPLVLCQSYEHVIHNALSKDNLNFEYMYTYGPYVSRILH